MYYSSSSGSKKNAFWYILSVIVAMFFIYCLVFSSSFITEDKALERIKEVTKSDSIEIIHHTNLYPFFGDPYKAVFEIKIDGKYYSAELTSGEFSDLTCKIYHNEVK